LRPNKKYILLCASSLLAQQRGYLQYDQSTFDGDSCCWRKLSRLGAYEKSAKMIVDYIEMGNVANRQSLNWHAGQMFAFAGQNVKALKYFNKTYSVFQKWFGGEDGKAWFFFAKGTSAFLKRDKAALEKIIRKWKRKLPVDNNLTELEMLLKNWNENYKSATTDSL
jgi:hypothetical protein